MIDTEGELYMTKIEEKVKQYKDLLLKRMEGFTLVELMVALAILMLIVFAFTPLLVGSIERIHYAGDKSEALYQGQADMEVNIVQKDTIDGHEFVFEFGDNTTVTVPGGFIEVEQSVNDAVARLSTFLPYVPSIRLSDPFLIEGYDGESIYLPMVIMGSDTKLEGSDYVYIYKRETFNQGGLANYSLPFQIVSQPEGQPSGYDEYAAFNLPAGQDGLINANSPHIVELDWVAGELTVKVRARLHITLPRAVIVGSGGTIKVSPDADGTWNARNNETEVSVDINDIIWANFRYVAVTSTGKALIWGNQEEPHLIDVPGLGTVSLNSLAYGAGKLVAVGNGGNIAVSTSGGETWSLVENLVTNTNLQAVSHNGNEFVAVGNSGIIISSVNGSDWQVEFDGVPGDHLDFFGLAYGSGTWVIVGDIRPADPAASRRYLIYTGTVGGPWVETDRGESSSSLYSTSYSVVTDPDVTVAEKFTAVGADGRIMTSIDGFNWSSITKTSVKLNRIFWDGFWNNQFIIVGSGGIVLTGTGDTNDWVTHSAGSENFKGVTIRWEN